MTEDENLEYDQKIGFTLRSPTVRDSGVIVCEANRNDINESRTLQVTINRELSLLHTWYLVIECGAVCIVVIRC